MAKLINQVVFIFIFVTATAFGAPLQLKNYNQNSSTIELIFDRNIAANDFKTTELKGQNSLRRLIDINAVNRITSSKITNSKIKEIRVAQFNPQVARVVFEHNQNFDLITKINGNRLIIEIVNLNFQKNSSLQGAVNSSLTNSSLKPNSKNKIIVIDPGHGGKDSGTTGYGVKEKDLVLKIALKLGDILKSRGYTVFFTRQKDVFISLRDRSSFANKKAADLFVSIHINATGNEKIKDSLHGFETYFLSPTRSERSKEAANLENKSDTADMDFFSKQTFLNVLNREKIIASNKLAIDVQKQALASIRTKYQVKDGGVREAPFWVLVGALMPAVLVEIGYISNQNESKKLINNDYQNLVAKGVADGIELYFQKND